MTSRTHWPPSPGARHDYEPVIGLEVHAQLRTRTKIFCGCRTAFGDPPNRNTCPVCLGMPGALPVLNHDAVEMAVKMALAVGAELNSPSVFARKNYFYPDLPKGYQISQFELPLCEGGFVPIETAGGSRGIGLLRIHLEEDAGKLLHGVPGQETSGTATASPHSYVDYNRAGVPLIEIVSKPEIRTFEEAARYLVRLRSMVTYLGICDGNMEEGSLRCDANLSLRQRGTATLGTRTELKNLNSFRHVQRALEYEAARQQEILETGAEVVQETRLWDEDRGVTVPMRSKEEAEDYRYFPEPDLPPLELGAGWIDRLRAGLPELPQARRARFVDDYALAAQDADLLSEGRALADFFEAVARHSDNPRAASNWVRGEVLRVLKESHRGAEDSPVSARQLADLIRAIDAGTISGKIAKTVFQEMAGGGGSPEEIIQRLGLVQITDEDTVRQAVEKVLQENPGPVQQFRDGKTAVLGFFVGQVMKATSGKANPDLVNRILRELLGGGGPRS